MRAQLFGFGLNFAWLQSNALTTVVFLENGYSVLVPHYGRGKSTKQHYGFGTRDLLTALVSLAMSMIS